MANINEPRPMGQVVPFVDNRDGTWSEKTALASGIVYTDVTLSLDTSIYADGDVLAATQVVSNAFRVDDQPGMLVSVAVIDEDDQKAAFDLYFLSADVSIGTENSTPSMSDANARNFCGYVEVGSGYYKDLGGVSVLSLANLNLPIKPISGTNDIAISAISRGTGTYTASGLKLRLGILCN